MDFDLADLSFFGIEPAPVFNEPGTVSADEERYWKFFSKEQKHRLEKIRCARMLQNGLHRQYFLMERRTQFKFPVARIPWLWGEADHQIFQTYNVCGMASTKGADLLFGDEPILRIAAPTDAVGDEAVIKVQEEAQRSFLRDLVDRCDLPALFHQKAEDATCDGEIYLESQIADGQVWLADVPSEEIFPVGPRRPDRQFAAYDRFTVTSVPAADPNAKRIHLLLITHYKIGSIDRECWRLHDGQKQEKIGLDQWPLAEGEPPLVEHQPTGLLVNTITCIPNQIRHGLAVNDYGPDVESLQDALNAKMSQIAWILAMHSQPKISRHTRHAQPDGNADTDYSVEYNDDVSQASKYITWDGQLPAALKDRDFTLEQLCVKLETSPVLLGITIGGNVNHATAFKSFRLMAANALSKAARKSNYWKAGIRRAIGICCQLANRLPGVRIPVFPVSVQLRDGIPLDALEEAQRLMTLKGAGLMSLKRGVNEQITDPAQAQDEIEEIQAEEAAATPSILMQPPTSGGEEATTETPSQEEDEARGERQNDLDVAA